VTYADEAFETPVKIDRKPGLILLAQNQGFYHLSQTTGGSFATEKLGQAPSLGRLTLRAQQLILYPSDLAQDAAYVFPHDEGPIAQQAGEQARLYNELSPEARAQVVDTFIAAQWWARIFKERVEFACDYRSDSLTSVALPEGKTALGFIFPDGYSRAARSVLVSFSDGSLYEAVCQSSTQAQLNDIGKKYDVPLKRVYKDGGVVIGVDAAGSLYQVINGQPQALATSGVGPVFEIAPFETFSFFD